MGASVGEITSKVSPAMKGKPSLRTTVPQPIATALGVEDGSTLVWKFEPGSRSATVEIEQAKKSKRR